MTAAGTRPRSSWALLLLAAVGLLALPSPAPAHESAKRAGRLAFHADPGGADDLFVVGTDGKHRRRLTKGLEEVAQPVWSPGGKRIAFLARPLGIEQIYVIGSDGKRLRRLTASGGDNHDLAWSPDGRRIAFACCGESPNDIYVIDLTTRRRTRLARNAAQPRWSRNGRRIVFTTFTAGNADIAVMNSDGSAATRLTDAPAEDSDPVWSPDGSKIAFTSKRDGRGQIYVMNASGSAQRRLVDDEWDDETPSWSPSGRAIVFTSFRNEDPLLRGIGNADIVVASAAGGDAANLTRSRYWEGDPAWSPDGSRLAFSIRRDFGPRGTFQLGVMRASGSDKRFLPPVRSGDRSPANSCCPSWRP